MVGQLPDRFEGFLPCSSRRRHRTFAKQPLSDRLQKWVKKAFAKSSFMRTRKEITRLQLPAALYNGLNLPDGWVTIDSVGILRHASREQPLASV